MVQKLILAAATAAVIGILAATGTTAEAGHRHHAHHHHGHSHGGSYGGYYGGGVVYAPRVYAQPVYPYPVYQSYRPSCAHSPYGGGYGYPSGYGYGGYAPYNQAFGVRSGNFSLFLGR